MHGRVHGGCMFGAFGLRAWSRRAAGFGRVLVLLCLVSGCLCQKQVAVTANVILMHASTKVLKHTLL